MNTKILNWGSGAKPVKQFGSKANKSLITLSFLQKKTQNRSGNNEVESDKVQGG